MKNDSSSRAYNVWTETEEQALREGVRRYGVGSWEPIRQDKSFSILKNRSGVQLKDKWRNLVKFRKLNGKELQNLPRRATGPWSKKTECTKGKTGRVSTNMEYKRGGSRCEDRRYGIYDFRRYARGVSSEDSDVSTHECDNGIVACPCGMDFDDGQPMIECVQCKERAHTTCLPPLHEKNGEERYVCGKCRPGKGYAWPLLATDSDDRGRKYTKVMQDASAQTIQVDSFRLQSFAPFRGMSVTTAAYMLTELFNTLPRGGGCVCGSESETSLPSEGSHSKGRPSQVCGAIHLNNSNNNINPRKRKQFST